MLNLKMSTESYLDIVLKFGLFVGGIFQLLCILALVFVPVTFLKNIQNNDLQHPPYQEVSGKHQKNSRNKNNDRGKKRK